jgi:4-amino-4-deoxychorismate lyase
LNDPLLIDGKSADQIPVSDRGLQYGDGLFETIAVFEGRTLQWARHMARLQKGEQTLKFPTTDKQQLRREAKALLAHCQQGVLKIILTRGSGGRGYRPPSPTHPRRILSLHPWPDYPRSWYEQGVALRLCETRLARQTHLAGIKHLNRLDQVMARSEWNDPSIVEGIMRDEHGNLISGTQSNLFAIQGNNLITPDVSDAGVAGVVRDLVLESAPKLDLIPKIVPLRLDTLKQANALFITNSLLGVCPVNRFEEQCYDVNAIPHGLRSPEFIMGADFQ